MGSRRALIMVTQRSHCKSGPMNGPRILGVSVSGRLTESRFDESGHLMTMATVALPAALAGLANWYLQESQTERIRLLQLLTTKSSTVNLGLLAVMSRLCAWAWVVAIGRVAGKLPADQKYAYETGHPRASTA